MSAIPRNKKKLETVVTGYYKYRDFLIHVELSNGGRVHYRYVPGGVLTHWMPYDYALKFCVPVREDDETWRAVIVAQALSR